MGAHLCSIVYKTYTRKYGVRLGRITGLDPAGPLFADKSESERLTHTDAHLVDIIHTSQDFGIAGNSGHMDFYPDDGPNQLKACDMMNKLDTDENAILYEEESSDDDEFENIYLDESVNATRKTANKRKETLYAQSINSVTRLFKSMVSSLKDLFYAKPRRFFFKVHQFFGCSHLAAMRLFIYSINQCAYRATYCVNRNAFINGTCHWNVSTNESGTGAGFPRMGYWADKSARFYKQRRNASFFLNISHTRPYCFDPTVVPELPKNATLVANATTPTTSTQTTTTATTTTTTTMMKTKKVRKNSFIFFYA